MLIALLLTCNYLSGGHSGQTQTGQEARQSVLCIEYLSASIVRPFWPEKHRTGAWRGRQSNDGSIQPLLQDQQWTVQFNSSDSHAQTGRQGRQAAWVDFDRQPSQTARPASSAGLLFVKAARQPASHCTGKEGGKECKIPLYNLDSESNLDMRSILNPLNHT